MRKLYFNRIYYILFSNGQAYKSPLHYLIADFIKYPWFLK